MKRTFSSVLLLLAFGLLVTACERTPDEQSDDESEVYGALDAAEWALDLTLGEWDMQRLRPSGLLGVYATQFLTHATSVRGALVAIDAHAELYFDDRGDRDESFELLEELGTTLQVDIADMLNRSLDRTDTFNTYVSDLTMMLQASHDHKDELVQQLEDIQDERREQRREVAELQGDLNDALREQDYATAGSRQEELIEAESTLAKTTAREDEMRSIICLFEDLIEVGEVRVIAMEENREAILAGIDVVAVPGIEDLGVIRNVNNRELRDRRSIFDPSSN